MDDANSPSVYFVSPLVYVNDEWSALSWFITEYCGPDRAVDPVYVYVCVFGRQLYDEMTFDLNI